MGQGDGGEGLCILVMSVGGCSVRNPNHDTKTDGFSKAPKSLRSFMVVPTGKAVS
jgi:hypothetical protein